VCIVFCTTRRCCTSYSRNEQFCRQLLTRWGSEMFILMFLAYSKNELMQWRGVCRLSVCLSVCKLLRKSLLLADKWPDRHQTFTRRTPGQRASRVRSRSKVTWRWYAHFLGFLEWATPSLTVWLLCMLAVLLLFQNSWQFGWRHQVTACVCLHACFCILVCNYVLVNLFTADAL